MNWLKRNWAKVVTLVLAALVGMRILDLLMLWGLFSKFASTFRGLGVTNDNLVNAISVALMTVAALVLRYIFWKFIFRRTEQGTLLFGGIITAWMLLLYFVSLPSAGAYFNPVTGQPRYVYALLPDGEIDLKPLGHKYHPYTGEEMFPLTKEALKQNVDKIRRFEKRQPKSETPPIAQTVSAKTAPDPVRTAEYPRFLTNPHISLGHDVNIISRNAPVKQSYALMCVRSVRINPEELFLLLEFRNIRSLDFLTLIKPGPNDTYLVSDTGEGLRIRTCHKDAFPIRESLSFLSPNVMLRQLLPGEVWQLGAWFPPLTKTTKELILTYQAFEKVAITLLE